MAATASGPLASCHRRLPPAAIIGGRRTAVGDILADPERFQSAYFMVKPRTATLDDVPLLVEMMQEFYAEASYPLDRQWATDAFSTLLRDDARGAVWIVFDGAEAAGYVVLTVRFSMEYGGLDAFVDDLFIRPRHRRKGLGRAALRALFEECDRRNVLAVHVEVGRGNAAANALYEAFGLGLRDDDRQVLTVRLRKARHDA